MAATARATWLYADARCVHLARALLFSGLSFRLSVSLHQQKAGYKELEAGECHLVYFVETNKKLFFFLQFLYFIRRCLLRVRLDEAKSSELEATNKWQQERRQVAHIEKQMNRIQSGQGVAKGKAKGYSSAGGIQDSRAKMTDDLDELSTR